MLSQAVIEHYKLKNAFLDGPDNEQTFGIIGEGISLIPEEKCDEWKLIPTGPLYVSVMTFLH